MKKKKRLFLRNKHFSVITKHIFKILIIIVIFIETFNHQGKCGHLPVSAGKCPHAFG